MNEEQLKDVRQMLVLISKDLIRLSDDVKCLSQFMNIKQDDNLLNFRNCDNCKFRSRMFDGQPCLSCRQYSYWEEADDK